MHEAMKLLGDIGGTHARFGLLARGSQRIEHESTLVCADFDSLERTIRHYLSQHGNPLLDEAALDVATSVLGDTVHLTNGPWEFSIEQTRRNLGLHRLQVINDFTALALAIPVLAAHESRPIGGGVRVPESPIALIGPGTGLGVSGLLPTGKGWIALQGEGGHAAFSPGNRREIAVLTWLLDRYPYVSRERVVSGMGLENLYHAICALDGIQACEWKAPQITAAAVSASNLQCREALEMFCAILGSAAADLVLALGARGGCYIGGGIVPRLGEYFARSPFRARFEDKGRFSAYMTAVPTYVVLAPASALRGLATLLQEET